MIGPINITTIRSLNSAQCNLNESIVPGRRKRYVSLLGGFNCGVSSLSGLILLAPLFVPLLLLPFIVELPLAGRFLMSFMKFRMFTAMLCCTSRAYTPRSGVIGDRSASLGSNTSLMPSCKFNRYFDLKFSRTKFGVFESSGIG